MREFILEDGSMLVLCEEVELLDITLLSDPQIRRLAVPAYRLPHEQVSPSSPLQAVVLGGTWVACRLTRLTDDDDE